MESKITLSLEEYNNLKDAQKYHLAEVQRIWDNMMERDTLIISETSKYKKTYRLFSPDSMAAIITIPLWRIIRIKIRGKHHLEKIQKLTAEVDLIKR